MSVDVGPLLVIGEGEAAPASGWWVRILPHAHPNMFAWWSDSTRNVLERMEARRSEIEGASVLDFGCGASAILSSAARALGAAAIYPVEIHPEIAAIAMGQLSANAVDAIVRDAPDQAHYDFALANVGDAVLVGTVARLATHGIGTDESGEVIEW